MFGLDDVRRPLRSWFQGVLFWIGGAAFAAVSGRQLYALPDPWASNSPFWLGFFMGILFFGFGCATIWERLFAPPLTPEQGHFRRVNEDWQEERRRLFGDGF